MRVTTRVYKLNLLLYCR